jgi:hypothetical protein
MNIEEIKDSLQRNNFTGLRDRLDSAIEFIDVQQAEIDSLQKKLDVALMIVNKPEPAFRWALIYGKKDSFKKIYNNAGEEVPTTLKVLQQAWIDILTGEVEWKNLETVDLRKAQEK